MKYLEIFKKYVSAIKISAQYTDFINEMTLFLYSVS